ncbi:MAG: phosphatidylserine decarboxylase family protein [Bacteroidetes bacterium]|nr:phosphatidylserine decarboxylase family protein [Bacteroidota bacterium]
MRFHREGTFTIIMTIIFCIVVNAGIFLIYPSFGIVNAAALLCTLVLLYIILQFFRNPVRTIKKDPRHIIAPADGKVVVIEEVDEKEYFNDSRIQLSIFMSPFNVHVNRNPIGGKFEYVKYHPGLYLVAWHPKSSTENERTTIVIKNEEGQEVLFRQIAGAMAKRIVYYAVKGETAEQGAQMGFIKFGSRVDVLLPVNAKINVKLNETVRGGETVIATF